jgi:hypothetical protein
LRSGRRGAYGGTWAQEDLPSARDAAAELRVLPLFSEAGSNIVESVAIPVSARSGSVIAAVAV